MMRAVVLFSLFFILFFFILRQQILFWSGIFLKNVLKFCWISNFQTVLNAFTNNNLAINDFFFRILLDNALDYFFVLIFSSFF